jgi:hypothetical protein
MMSSYLHVPEEVSDEARLGNPKHWAYVTDKETKKAPERSRREVQNTNTLAAAAAVVEGEFASRSEARREAVAARKSRAHQVDSDFDDRPPPKKGPGKAKKPVEDPKSVGLGIANGVVNVGKRKKVPGSAPMERSISGALANASRGGQASPRETPDIVSKKRTKPGPAPKKRYVNMLTLGIQANKSIAKLQVAYHPSSPPLQSSAHSQRKNLWLAQATTVVARTQLQTR